LFDVLPAAQRVFQLKDNGRHLIGYEQSQKRAGMRLVTIFTNFQGQRCREFVLLKRTYPFTVTT
jgi:hypothetical protein